MPDSRAIRSPLPYRDILSDLVASIMKAQGELLTYARTGKDADDFPDVLINRHFSWLALTCDEGLNRHFFEGVGKFPLRTKKLRAKKRIDEVALRTLKERQSIPVDTSGDVVDPVFSGLVQYRETRISALLKQSLFSILEYSTQKRDEKPLLVSPLKIALEFLTIPEAPGSNAYALLALRNYLFESFGVVPADLADLDQSKIFTVRQIEEAHSRIWTSLRPRHWSSGEDKLPAAGRLNVDGLLRQFFALKGALWFRFEDFETCIAYCKAGRFDPRSSHNSPFELDRSPHLAHLPDLGEVINELWGLPIPIRGADTIFKGGLKFSSQRGLVVAVHGGPGTGKTSLALALGAYLAPFHIDTLFLTGEEHPKDLSIRVEGLVPSEFRRLTFFPRDASSWLTIASIPRYSENQEGALTSIESAFEELKSALGDSRQTDSGVPKPCRAIIVLDGMHDIFFNHANPQARTTPNPDGLRRFIDKCRELKALVFLTTSQEWAGDTALDYLVDVSLQLSYRSDPKSASKPERQLLVSKARHQHCAIGSHGIQIAGAKGLRFSPEITYTLDRLAVWKTRLPDQRFVKDVLRRTMNIGTFENHASRLANGSWHPRPVDYYTNIHSANICEGSNIFINGRGSSGKAGLALKIAASPLLKVNAKDDDAERVLKIAPKILVISFLYPEDYYERILFRVVEIRNWEYGIPGNRLKPELKVMQLYPGHYLPRDLFNRIEWELEAAELGGQPYNTAVIDGIHNVFIQFPEIQQQGLFWPQLYALLRSRSMNIITTHTTLMVPHGPFDKELAIDDHRSEPLRHALVQKTDYQIEVDPVDPDQAKQSSEGRIFGPNLFMLKFLSAFNQPIPDGHVYWSREDLMLFGGGPIVDGITNVGLQQGKQPMLPSIPSVNESQTSLKGRRLKVRRPLNV